MDPVPAASSAAALSRMQRQRRRDTKPELALRRELHRLGLRYRVDRRLLSGMRRRVDIVFGPAKVAVFVDGCFWHSCPQHATLPRANAQWWADKLAANVERDSDSDRELAECGWLVVHVWEHEGVADAAARVREIVLHRRLPAGTIRLPVASRRTGPIRPCVAFRSDDAERRGDRVVPRRMSQVDATP